MGLDRLTCAVLVLGLLAGCAHQPRLGEECVVQRSGSRPGWVDAAEPVVEGKETWLFRGVVTRAPSLEMALREAEADAKKRLVGLVSERVEAEYTQYATSSGAAEPSRFVADGISWASRQVVVSGARPAKTYWERVAVAQPAGFEYHWRAWCLLAVSKSDVELARKRASEALDQRRRRLEERQAEEEAKRLREKLDKEP